MNPIATATAGLIAARAQFDQASADVVTAASSASQGDLATAVVNQAQAKSGVEASVGVVKVADQMFGSLLNILV